MNSKLEALFVRPTPNSGSGRDKQQDAEKSDTDSKRVIKKRAHDKQQDAEKPDSRPKKRKGGSNQSSWAWLAHRDAPSEEKNAEYKQQDANQPILGSAFSTNDDQQDAEKADTNSKRLSEGTKVHDKQQDAEHPDSPTVVREAAENQT